MTTRRASFDGFIVADPTEDDFGVVDRWRLLLCFGVDRGLAAKAACDPSTTPSRALALSREQRHESDSVRSVGVPELVGESRGDTRQPEGLAAHLVFDELDRLPLVQRHAIGLVYVLGMQPAELSEYGLEASVLDAARDALRREKSDRDLWDFLAPVLTMDPPPCPEVARRAPLALIATLLILAVLLVGIARASAPDRPASALPPSQTSSTAVAVTPSTGPSTTSTTTTSMPQREVSVVVSERGTLVRLDPVSGEQIWESLPLAEPEIVEIHLNTIELTSIGRPVVMSLIDGTILPG